jgi:ABC-type antimicrobial peptide transport system permease subunit
MGTEGAFIVDAYPVKLIATDTIFVFLTVLTVGFLGALYPVRYLTNKWLK